MLHLINLLVNSNLMMGFEGYPFNFDGQTYRTRTHLNDVLSHLGQSQVYLIPLPLVVQIPPTPLPVFT